MDRDTNWERTEKAYNAIVKGEGTKTDNLLDSVKASYENNVTDEFILPLILNTEENTRIEEEDGVIFANFRPDRARQLTRAIVDKDFNGFNRKEYLNTKFVCMAQYDIKIEAPVAYPPEKIVNGFGEVIAKKTFNERLGIVKGISIIGTTGIVEPMSIEALKSSIEKEIKVKSKEGDKIVLSFGNMGEKALNKLGISSDKICICSNYVGDALEYISNCDNVTDVLIAGNFAKAVKLAGGIFNTHSHVADAKNEIIAANLALLNAPYELIKSVMEANTSRQITQYISSNNFERVYDVLARRAEEKCDIFIKHGFKNHILMFDYDDEMLNSVDISIFI